ncbi:MAG: hypothetical protein JRC92_03835 [Deltaproteobacteria bacterium]|nr:hypothetical protein [Deltaproteobacteria bacterium]
MMKLNNLLFKTNPVVVHCGGPLYPIHEHHWRPIKEAFFAAPPRKIGPIPDLTIITFNNGHNSLGVLEESLNRLGLSYLVLGREVEVWNNAVHKPRLTWQAAEQIETEFILGLDSRDAILLDDPRIIIERFRLQFDCQLLIGADRFSYPPLKAFKEFEDSIPEAAGSDFHYMVAGTWFGRTEFIRNFFAEAVRTEPLPEAPRSEQGVLRSLFPKYYPAVGLDYCSVIFQNVGFLSDPILEIS